MKRSKIRSRGERVKNIRDLSELLSEDIDTICAINCWSIFREFSMDHFLHERMTLSIHDE